MKIYVASHNGVLDEYKRQIEYAPPLDADKLVIWQDCEKSFRELTEMCRRVFPKPIYTMQHGVRASRDYDKPLYKKFNSDMFLAWGRWDYDNMRRQGFPATIVGCPLNPYVKPRVPHKEKVVLFIPVSTGKEEPDNLLIYAELQKLKLAQLQKGLRAKYEALRGGWNVEEVTKGKLSDNFTLLAKVLPWHDRKFYTDGSLIGYQDSERNNLLLFDLLRNVDVVVGLDEGTTELFAVAHDVPVIVVKGFEYRWTAGKTYVTPSNAVTHVKLKDLNSAVEHALEHPEYLRKERAAKAENEMSLQSVPDPIRRIHEVVGSKPINNQTLINNDRY